jgi:Mn-dependent DtxR family transcriptional regulator
MLLITIKQYIKNKRLVSLHELASCFSIDPEAMRDMLNFLIRKGNVRKQNKTNKCGTQCTRCHPSKIEMYEWVGA